ncbi:MAG: hypothetical protein K2L83_08900 [Muribaculaceae bacterium]|nr:hypothetical protein [Muribaculaceae bacterium]
MAKYIVCERGKSSGEKYGQERVAEKEESREEWPSERIEENEKVLKITMKNSFRESLPLKNSVSLQCPGRNTPGASE